VLGRLTYFESTYDVALGRVPSRWLYLTRSIVGPLLLGYLVTRAQGFIYIGSGGYLLSEVDHRDFEFSFVKRHARLCCYWTGNDIRSNVLMHEMERKTGEPNTSTYQGFVSPYLETPLYDETKKAIALVADRYADVMFSFPTSQRSYLRTRPETPMYFYPDDKIIADLEKHDDPIIRPVVVHAPSSPIGKGTPLVRAAVTQLVEEGYDLEYVELTGVSNQVVLSTLRRANIALNHFYGSQPGVFGVEAMAAGCVMLTSADETVETRLPPHSNQAWVVTKHHQLYRRLREVLDAPESWHAQASRGIEWVRANATASHSGKRLRSILDSVLDGSYIQDAEEEERARGRKSAG